METFQVGEIQYGSGGEEHLLASLCLSLSLSLSVSLSLCLSVSLSLSLSSCFAPGPDQNGGESPIQQLLILTFAKAMLAECGQPDIYRWWPSHDPKAAGGLAASLSWKEKRAHRVQGP